MRKIAALALAVVLVMQTAVFVSADLTESSASGSSPVTYEAVVGYTVKIPAATQYDRANGNTLEFSASVSYIPPGQTLQVTIDGLDGSNLAMTSGSDTFPIPVTLGGAPCANGSVVAKFDENGAPIEGIGALRLESGAKPPAAGSYSGALTFTVALQ